LEGSRERPANLGRIDLENGLVTRDIVPIIDFGVRLGTTGKE
jgi:hypothetical protein